MKRFHPWIILIVTALALAACEKKEDAVDSQTTGAEEAKVENIVEVEIPDDLAREAEAEITEANAEQMAAELEKEIEADL